ncbi:MAG: hypothetical protein JW754_01520 [Candidatus Aenigmarchaeota archaeon]|nr:hypothetical protein [Candidatus Aenigmarchaeota archaeon]
MNFNFRINDDYLAADTINKVARDRFSSYENAHDLRKLAQYAEETQSSTYGKLIGLEYPCEVILKPENLSDILNNLEKIKKSSEFSTIRDQVSRYIDFLVDQWKRNGEMATDTVRELTGLPMNDEYTVFVTHPNLCNGIYLGDKKIAWGHAEDWPNYSTVYLTHEALHDTIGWDDPDHSIIQLIADNELRVRMNGGEYPPLLGHPGLVPMMEKMLPAWNDNLKSPDFEKFRERAAELVK